MIGNSVDITIYVGPRGFGKTTRCRKLLYNNTPDAMLIVNSSQVKRHVEKQMQSQLASGAVSPQDIITGNASFATRRPKPIILLDDYLMLSVDRRKILHDWFNLNKDYINDILCFTTSDRLYSKSSLRTAKKLKKMGVNPYSFTNKVLEGSYYNLLSEQGADIHHVYQPPTEDQINMASSKEELLTEVIGLYEYRDN